MKKWYICLALLFCMLCMSGCSEEEPKLKNVYQVYQISSSGTAVEAHGHEMQATEKEEMLEELITCMSTTPEKLEYKAPFTMGFQLLSMKLDGKVVWLDMSEEYLKLPVMTEVLVRAAIVRTLTQVEEIKYVGMTVEGSSRSQLPGLLYQQKQRLLHPLLMAVGHQQTDTADIEALHRRLIPGHPPGIAIAGNPVQRNVGKFLGQHIGIVKMIPKMNNGLRLHRLHKPFHIIQRRMRIGHNKYFHSSPARLSVHIVVLAEGVQNHSGFCNYKLRITNYKLSLASRPMLCRRFGTWHL